MSGHKPDTNVMRATYATAVTYRQSPSPERAAEFDRWLDQERADAWEIGRSAGVADAARIGPHGITHSPNPYRSADQ